MSDLRERKLDAIQDMYARIRTDNHGRITMTRQEVTTNIRTLLTVVASAKWRDAVESYAALVADTANDLDWAYGQGSIWFAYAVMS